MGCICSLVHCGSWLHRHKLLVRRGMSVTRINSSINLCDTENREEGGTEGVVLSPVSSRQKFNCNELRNGQVNNLNVLITVSALQRLESFDKRNCKCLIGNLVSELHQREKLKESRRQINVSPPPPPPSSSLPPGNSHLVQFTTRQFRSWCRF